MHTEVSRHIVCFDGQLCRRNSELKDRFSDEDDNRPINRLSSREACSVYIAQPRLPETMISRRTNRSTTQGQAVTGGNEHDKAPLGHTR